jgi:hypothetical protein
MGISKNIANDGVADYGIGGGLTFTFDNATTASDPGTGKLRYDSATPASITNLYISDTSVEGLNITSTLLLLAASQQILIRQLSQANKAILVSVSGAVTDNGSWFTIPVTFVSVGSGGLHTNNKNIIASKIV